MVNDLEGKYQIRTYPVNILSVHDNMNRNKYFNLCLKQRQHFTPTLFSTDGMIGPDSNTMVISISLKLPPMCVSIPIISCFQWFSNQPITTTAYPVSLVQNGTFVSPSGRMVKNWDYSLGSWWYMTQPKSTHTSTLKST